MWKCLSTKHFNGTWEFGDQPARSISPNFQVFRIALPVRPLTLTHPILSLNNLKIRLLLRPLHTMVQVDSVSTFRAKDYAPIAVYIFGTKANTSQDIEHLRNFDSMDGGSYRWCEFKSVCLLNPPEVRVKHFFCGS